MSSSPKFINLVQCILPSPMIPSAKNCLRWSKGIPERVDFLTVLRFRASCPGWSPRNFCVRKFNGTSWRMDARSFLFLCFHRNRNIFKISEVNGKWLFKILVNNLLILYWSIFYPTKSLFHRTYKKEQFCQNWSKKCFGATMRTPIWRTH